MHYNTTSTSPVLTVANSYTYDHVGRKTQTFESINGGLNVLVAQNNYNEIGQLQTRSLHSENNGGSFLQANTYAYNERGWMLQINDPTVTPTVSKMFSMKLSYNSGSSPQYNGNISSQQWYTYNGSQQTFNYSYDQLNRLVSGSSSAMAESAISYDQMGNIQTLTRDANSPYSYSYLLGGNPTNQLQTVSGLTTGSYLYDLNGNMVTDARNGTALTYNVFNLPQTVTKTGSVNIAYTYDATGQKLRKVSNTSATDYIGGIRYDSSSGSYGIDFIQTEDGRAAKQTDGSYRYQYDLTDHLMNARATFTKDPTTLQASLIQADDYYPFGMLHVVTSGTNNYLYNKKELQTELGQYDYSARFYDPVIARFTTIDPLANKYSWYTPYQFAGNEVPNAIDRDGLEPAYPRANGQWVTARDGQLNRGTSNPDALIYQKSKLNPNGPFSGFDGTGNKVSTAGTAVIAVGYIGALFTEGGSLALVPYGEGLESVGAGLSVTEDLSKGNVKDAVVTASTSIIFGAAGKKIEALEEVGKLTSVQKPILGALLSTTSKLTDVSIDKTKEEKKTGEKKVENSKERSINQIKFPNFEPPTMKKDNIQNVHP